jgi:RNA polymerase sigma-70 factor (sigma-E family)
LGIATPCLDGPIRRAQRIRIDNGVVGGKPAHTVVDSRAGRAAHSSPDAALASESATVGYLSAPPDDPIADARTGPTAGDAHAIDQTGDTNGAVFRAGPAGFAATPGSGIGGGNLPADGEPSDPVTRPTEVTEVLAASALLPEVIIAPEAFIQARSASVAWDASEAVTEIYKNHYNQLVRLAVMLVHDVQTAEEVVQDAFEAMHFSWRRLRDTEKALSYLRQTIVNKSRSVLRHRKVVEMHPPKPAPDEQSAEHAALTLIERSAVTSALRALPERQREAIVLRYYGDFCEADIAKAMGISKGAVKSHTARAMAALKSILLEAL